MATYQVTAPDGSKLKLTGESPPTEQELEQIFAQRQKLAGEMTHQGKPMEGTSAERTLPKIAESGVLYGEDPIRVAAITPVLLTATDPKEFSQIVRKQFPHIRQQQDESGNEIIYNPKNKVQTVIGGGKLAILQGLGIAAAYSPTGSVANAATTTAGKIGLSGLAAGATETAIQTAQQLAGGQANPEQVAASTAFGAGAEAVGIGISALREGKQADKLIKKAAPSADDLKEAVSQLYKQVDDSGAMISGGSINKLKANIFREVGGRGMMRSELTTETGAALQPKSTALLKIIDKMDGPQTVSDLEQLRRIAQKAAQGLDKQDAGTARKIVEVIDSHLDDLAKSGLMNGTPAAIKSLQSARDLAHRQIKDRMISDVLKVAEDQASGVENGIRTQVRAILKKIDTSKLKGFTQEEYKALKQVSQGTTPANIFRVLGKFGVFDKQHTTTLMASLGSAGGYAAGGPAGAIVVPAIGQVSRKLATYLTENNAKFAQSVIRAGKNAKQVVITYMRNVPKNERNINDLASLLMKTNLDSPALKTFAQGSQFIRDSLLYGALLQSKQADEIQPPQEIQTEVRP